MSSCDGHRCIESLLLAFGWGGVGGDYTQNMLDMFLYCGGIIAFKMLVLCFQLTSSDWYI